MCLVDVTWPLTMQEQYLREKKQEKQAQVTQIFGITVHVQTQRDKINNMNKVGNFALIQNISFTPKLFIYSNKLQHNNFLF